MLARSASLIRPIAGRAGLAFRRGRCRFSTGTEAAAIAAMPVDQWAAEFKKATVDLASMDIHGISYEESAQRMRELLRTGLLRHTDLNRNPERFFLAHRLLAEHAPQLGPGFWIRFTVHYNLCAGTVLALGNAEQVAGLDDMQAAGELGCFALTEKLAGVNSGLVVNTTANWDETSQTFALNTADVGACKNWISQGLVADKTTVVADLRIDGKSYGPHAFLMNLREGGRVVPGVTLTDMGRKTIGNDLDNASIAFDGVRLPKSALLNRYADVEGGAYVQKVKGMPVFHMIGQRLFTGRVAVAQAALAFRRGLFASAKAYADAKLCWSPGGGGNEEPVLSGVPQLRALFAEADERAGFMEEYVGKCERELCVALRNDSVPSVALVEAIAVAKVRAVEDCIELCHRLQNEVGSYALMAGTGFEQIDFLTCCKFAEGDSRILMQKMARDRLKLFQKAQQEGGGGPQLPAAAVSAGTVGLWQQENDTCASLAGAMAAAPKAERLAVWDDKWEDVYALAAVVMERTTKEFMASSG